MLEGFFYQGEIPSTVTLSDMLVKLIVAAECDNDVNDGADDLTAGLVKAWIGAALHEIADEDYDDADARLDLLTEREAEKAYGDAYRKVYCQRVYGRKPKDDDEIGWWPECLNYHGFFPRKLLVKIARTLAGVEADRDQAAMRYAREQYPQYFEGDKQ